MKVEMVLVTFLLAHTAAGEEALPKPRAGLWQLEISVGMNIPPQKLNVCIDEETDGAVLSLNPGMPCSKQSVHRDADKVTIDAQCTMGSSAATIQTSASGDFQSSYSLDIVSRFDPPIDGQVQSHQVIDGNWLGQCRGEQQPGEAIMEDGTRITLVDQ